MKISEIIQEAKIIAYHGTGSRIEQFNHSNVFPNFFTTDPEYAKGYVGKSPMGVFSKPKRKPKNYLLTVELTIDHPFDTKNDPEALRFYNEQFIPDFNQLTGKYGRPPILPIQAGRHVSFVYADDVYRYFQHYGATHNGITYDAILVDEGGLSVPPAIIPLHANQIRILKRQIIKFDQ